jgi:hypothetical protein
MVTFGTGKLNLTVKIGKHKPTLTLIVEEKTSFTSATLGPSFKGETLSLVLSCSMEILWFGRRSSTTQNERTSDL